VPRSRPTPRQLTTVVAATCTCALSLAACGGSKGTTSARSGTTSASTGASSGTTGTQSTSTTGTGTNGTGTGTGTGEAAASREVSPHQVTSRAGQITATLHVARGHHPRVGERWPIAFTVTSAGKPIQAGVAYEYLFGGAVVAHRSHYRFTGAFHDTFQWPSSAVGYPLTFRAVIAAAGRTLNLDYPVQVVR
jgi:hypothetical protein